MSMMARKPTLGSIFKVRERTSTLRYISLITSLVEFIDQFDGDH